MTDLVRMDALREEFVTRDVGHATALPCVDRYARCSILNALSVP